MALQPPSPGKSAGSAAVGRVQVPFWYASMEAFALDWRSNNTGLVDLVSLRGVWQGLVTYQKPSSSVASLGAPKHFDSMICAQVQTYPGYPIQYPPNSTNAVAANGQSGALVAMAPRMTAALKLCVQKKEKRTIIMGSRA